MKSVFYQLIIRARRMIWAIIVAFMLGMHNFYKGDDKTPDDISTAMEVHDAKEDGQRDLKVQAVDVTYP
jgi:hypothetical protein